MTAYTLYFAQTASHAVTIEADDLDAAIDRAYQRLPGALCHQCSSNYDMGGDWELDEKSAAGDYPNG